MNLPRSLQPWAKCLNIFPSDLSLALGLMAQRISSAIGPLNSQSHLTAGEPDGFDGLGRKGNYERLLAAEWLLADEFPDEFNRRSVVGEHLFLQLHRREPAMARVSMALFDAGPNQLGSPRIAHLATLIVLARRAEAAGASFGWAILQKLDTEIYAGVSSGDVTNLIKANTSTEATSLQLQTWLSRLNDWQDIDDLWLIGGTRLTNLSESVGLSQLHVSDLLDPTLNQISITVRPAKTAARQLALDLPDNKLCARLLRDPFENAQPELVRTDKRNLPVSNFVFGLRGKKLYTRSSRGGIMAYAIPNSPSDSVGPPKYYSADNGQIVAGIGRLGKTTTLITVRDRIIEVEYKGRSLAKLPTGGYVRINIGEDFASPTIGGVLQPCLGVGPHYPFDGELGPLVVDRNGTMFILQGNSYPMPPGRVSTRAGTAKIIAEGVLAVAPLRDEVVAVARELNKIDWKLMSISTGGKITHLFECGKPKKAFFGYAPTTAGYNSNMIIAIESTDDLWTTTNLSGDPHGVFPPMKRVVGVGCFLKNSTGPALVALEDDGVTLSLTNGIRTIHLPPASAPIAHAAASSFSPVVAYSTMEGEVVIYSLATERVLCSYLP